MNKPGIFLTFDVEQWLLPEDHNFTNELNGNTGFSSSGCANILDLLKRYDIKATFFITGYFAEREPQIVRMIDKAGHEVASHGYSHADLREYNKSDLKAEISRSTEVLSELVSHGIAGFRAPKCYVNQDIIAILAELGYCYDSSVHPAVVPGRYYNWSYPLNPYLPNGAGEVIEIPISVIPLIRFPISWWWMRNIGLWLTRFGTDINLRSNRNVIIYFHAWEFVELPFIKGQPLHLVKNCGEVFLNRLEKFIKFYVNKLPFRTLSELVKQYSAGSGI